MTLGYCIVPQAFSLTNSSMIKTCTNIRMLYSMRYVTCIIVCVLNNEGSYMSNFNFKKMKQIKLMLLREPLASFITF